MTARQELSRQRVGLASLDNSDTQDGKHTSAGLCISAAGAAGAAAADARDTATTAPEAELQSTHLRLQYKTGDVVRHHRWRTGAGEVTGYTSTTPVKDWSRRAAAQVEDRSRPTSREPAARVMDRRRSGQSWDSESRSLCTAGLGQPAGPRHSPAPTGVRRETSDGHCWIG